VDSIVEDSSFDGRGMNVPRATKAKKNKTFVMIIFVHFAVHMLSEK
jgi:hypothetical protein